MKRKKYGYTNDLAGLYSVHIVQNAHVFHHRSFPLLFAGGMSDIAYGYSIFAAGGRLYYLIRVILPTKRSREVSNV
ncbi:MAG: hypothetical protein FJY65_01795 [Calditrichaeota bacterium]|nr:hypothetical protein [Calditrichota bacterium]